MIHGKKVIVVLPAYNAEKTLRATVEGIPREFVDDVILVDDASRDRTVELARHHWHRMYSLPRHIMFHRKVPGYWEVDDHDSWVNDCWPTMEAKWMLPLNGS